RRNMHMVRAPMTRIFRAPVQTQQTITFPLPLRLHGKADVIRLRQSQFSERRPAKTAFRFWRSDSFHLLSLPSFKSLQCPEAARDVEAYKATHFDVRQDFVSLPVINCPGRNPQHWCEFFFR